MNTRIALLSAGLCLGIARIAGAQQALTNKDIWGSPLFSAEYVGGLASMKDGLHYTVLEEEAGALAINQYAYRTGNKVATLVKPAELVPAGSKEPVEMDDYSFSGDEKKMMIETGHEQLYRYSYFAHN